MLSISKSSLILVKIPIYCDNTTLRHTHNPFFCHPDQVGRNVGLLENAPNSNNFGVNLTLITEKPLYKGPVASEVKVRFSK